MKKLLLGSSYVTLALSAACTGSSTPPTSASESAQTPPVQTPPASTPMTAAQHRDSARVLAERSGYLVTYNLQCGTAGPTPPGATPPPTRLFDDFFYVGLSNVGAYVVRTSAGLILLDALNTPAEARDVIVPGMRALGLDPVQIKYVVISHGHGDHYGGAKYISDTYGARVMASAADWALIRGANAPARDLVVADGQKLTLGDFTMTMVLTPGHTAGTLSYVVPVSHQGARHTLAMWGGTGVSTDPAVRAQYVPSLDHFATFTNAANVDVELSNHPFVDGSLAKMDALRANPTGPNPLVVGQARYADYTGILKHCALASGAAQ